MQRQEVDEMTLALERIAPSISVCDIPSSNKDKQGNPTGERVLCAMLPPGMRFKANGLIVVGKTYKPGAAGEELAKRELLRQAGMGVTGSTGGHSARGVYDSSRYHKKLAAGRFAHS